MSNNNFVAYPLTAYILKTITGLITDPLLKSALAHCHIDDNFIYIPVLSINDSDLIKKLDTNGKLSFSA
jgi:hypothetical protein